MSDHESQASDIFNQLVGNAINRQPKEVVEFMSHPDNDTDVQAIINKISQVGGIKEIWQPQMVGIVIAVEDYYLDEDTRQKLNTTTNHQQSVIWMTINGHTMRLGWDNEKPLRDDVDYTDFPSGFKSNDCIRVIAEGAFVRKVERVTLAEIKSELAQKTK